jgi:hypothetical protein
MNSWFCPVERPICKKLDFGTLTRKYNNLLQNWCLPLFFFGFCERGQILSGIAKSRICRAFLSFCALILFEPFSLLFGVLGSTCAKWYFVPTPKWSMVAARWQQDGSRKCGGSAAAARRQGIRLRGGGNLSCTRQSFHRKGFQGELTVS